MKIFGISVDDINAFMNAFIDEHGHTTLKIAVIVISLMLTKSLLRNIVMTYKNAGKGKPRTKLERIKYSIQSNYKRDMHDANSMCIRRYLKGRFICTLIMVFLVFGTFVTTGETLSYEIDKGLTVLVFEKKDEKSYQYKFTKSYYYKAVNDETSDDYSYWYETSLSDFEIVLDEKNQPTLIVGEYWKDEWSLNAAQSENSDLLVFDEARYSDVIDNLNEEVVTTTSDGNLAIRKAVDEDTIELQFDQKTYLETKTQNYLFGIIQLEEESYKCITKYTIYYPRQSGHAIYYLPGD